MMKVAFQHYLEFKQAFRLKEYPCLIGFFFKVFGLAVAIRDEKRKFHYVRKSTLVALGKKYDFPYLNHTILLEQIKLRQAAGIQWNLLEMDRCGISLVERKKIEAVVKPLMEKGLVDQKFKKNREQLPVSLFIADGRVFLSLSKKKAGVAGKGGQRLIKFAYDLTKGRKVVRKPIGAQELEAMQCLQGIPGIAKAEAVFEGQVLFEKYYAGTLKHLIESRRPLGSAEVLQMARDLMAALSEIHKRTTKDGRPAFHSDIKLDNLFYRPSKKRGIEVVIGDLGFANSDEGVCGTCSWFSPEYAREVLERDLEKKFDQQFNRRYGQSLDLWCMGLVMASLLIQDGKGRLSCLRFGVNRQKTLQKILKVDQMMIDQEIALRQRQEPDKRLKELWNVVGGLLKVDPQKRASAALTLHQVSGLA